MRLIRSVSRPSNTSLLRQFQQCQVNKNSSARLDPVLLEASDLLHKSNIQCHGRSCTASASSDAMEARKPRRRLSKDERKSILEDYVQKYRETNGGKFPTTKGAIKDIGGSYYLVRHILQELMHKSKEPSEDAKEFSLKKSLSKKDEIFINVGEVSQTRDLGEVIAPVTKEDVRNSSSKVFESKQGQQSSVSVETDISKDVGTQSDHLIGKLESSLPPDPQNNVKQEKLEIELKFDGIEPKAGQKESAENSRRSQNAPSGDAVPQEKPSVWNNLKSLANGILSLWKSS